MPICCFVARGLLAEALRLNINKEKMKMSLLNILHFVSTAENLIKTIFLIVMFC
jgi:hypothetical protein